MADNTTLLIIIAILATMDICVLFFCGAIWWLLVDSRKEYYKLKHIMASLVEDVRLTLDHVATKLS